MEILTRSGLMGEMVALSRQDDAVTVNAVSAFDAQAVDFLEWFGRFPDPDLVLQKAGKSRQDLEQILTAPQIYDAYRKRWTLGCARKWKLEPNSGAAAEFLTPILRKHIPDILRMICRSLSFGYCVYERIYLPNEDKTRALGIEQFIEAPLHWFYPQRDGSLRMFRPNDPTMPVEGKEVNIDFKFLMARNEPTYLQPYGDAYLSKLFWPWYFIQSAAKAWGQGLERYVYPLIHGKKQGQLKDREKYAKEIFRALHRGVIATGNNEDITAIHMTLKDSSAFQQFCDFWIRAARILFLGHNMGTEVNKTGSYGAVGGASEITREYVDADLAQAKPLAQNFIHALVVLADLDEEPEFCWVDEEKKLVQDAKRVDRDMKMSTMGVRFTGVYFERKYELKKDEFEMAEGGDSPFDKFDPALKKNGKIRLAAEPLDNPAAETLAVNSLKAVPQPVSARAIADAVARAEHQADLSWELANLATANQALADRMAQTSFLATLLGFADESENPALRKTRFDNWSPVTFEEAIAFMEERGVVIPEIYYGELQGIARALGFSIAGISSVDQLQAVHESLAIALQEGMSYREWRALVTGGDIGLKLPDWRLENIFRTNIQVDYARGHYVYQEANAQNRPYGIIRVVNDDRLRPSHRKMRNFMAPLDDTIWQTITPPNGYNCRCRRLTLTVDEALEIEGAHTDRDLQADPGWNYHPGTAPLRRISAMIEARKGALDRLLEQKMHDFE